MQAEMLVDLAWSQYQDKLLQFQIGGESFDFLQSIRRYANLLNTDQTIN